MIDVLARIDALEQRLRAIARSRLLLIGALVLAVLAIPILLGMDPDVWLHILGALATVIAGATGLLKAIELWWASSENGKSAMESEEVAARDYEIAVLKRELHICMEGIGLHEEFKFNPERFR